MSGGVGNDTLVGGSGSDIIEGGTDLIVNESDPSEGSDNDLLLGGAGDDFLVPDFGRDTIDGGEGTDKLWEQLDYERESGTFIISSQEFDGPKVHAFLTSVEKASFYYNTDTHFVVHNSGFEGPVTLAIDNGYGTVIKNIRNEFGDEAPDNDALAFRSDEFLSDEEATDLLGQGIATDDVEDHESTDFDTAGSDSAFSELVAEVEDDEGSESLVGGGDDEAYGDINSAYLGDGLELSNDFLISLAAQPT